MDTISLAAATILAGLSAGLLCGWRAPVIPGTGRISSHAYVETMQSINRAILNPVFFMVFFGAPVAIAVAMVVSFVDDANARAGLLALEQAGEHRVRDLQNHPVMIGIGLVVVGDSGV